MNTWLLALVPLVASASPPPAVGYQGTMDWDGVPYTGGAVMRFRLYDAPKDGKLLWEETQTGVTVSHGRFSTRLGAVAPLKPAIAAMPALHLDVAVKRSGKAEDFVPLVTRQALPMAAAHIVLDPKEVVLQGLKASGSATVSGSADVTGALTVGGKLSVETWADFQVTQEVSVTNGTIKLPAFAPGHGMCFLQSAVTGCCGDEKDSNGKTILGGCSIGALSASGTPTLKAANTTCVARCFSW